MTLTGANFTGATAVKFNGTAASFTVVSATSLTALVPTGATSGTLSVTTVGGTATSIGSLTVVADPVPTITSITPASAGYDTVVTLTGTSFTGVTDVKFNGRWASFSVTSGTSIKAWVPKDAPSGPLTVTTLSGTATSASSFAFVKAPTITSFTPATGGVGTTVTLTDTNFSGATTVQFNRIPASSFTVVSATLIKVVVPTTTSGRITVTTVDGVGGLGGVGASTSDFIVIHAPTITSFTPTSGGVGTAVTLAGTYFSGATDVQFDGHPASSFRLVSPASIEAVVPTGAKSGPISVTTAGGTAISGSHFTFVAAATPVAVAPITPANPAVGTGTTTTFSSSVRGTANTGIIWSATAGVMDPSSGVWTAPAVLPSEGAGATSVLTLAGTGSVGANDGAGRQATFNNPTGVAVDISRHVYVADCYNHKIRKITPAGVVSTLAGTGAAGANDGADRQATFNNPSSVAVDASGNVYVADQTNNKIRKITPAGVVSTLAGTDAQGKNDGAGNQATFYAPAGLAVDTLGNVYVADPRNDNLRKITPAGVVTTLAGSGSEGWRDGAGSQAAFYNPIGVAVDIAGNVNVADQTNNKIQIVEPIEVVTVTATAQADTTKTAITTAIVTTGPTCRWSRLRPM